MEIKDNKLILTRKEGCELVWDNLEDFESVEDEVTSTGRWSIYHSKVVKHIPSGRFFQGCYSVGATEQQDEGPFECCDPDFTEVWPIEKTVTVYTSTPPN